MPTKEHPIKEHVRRAESRLEHARSVVQKHDLGGTPASDTSYAEAIRYEVQCEAVLEGLLTLEHAFECE